MLYFMFFGLIIILPTYTLLTQVKTHNKICSQVSAGQQLEPQRIKSKNFETDLV